MSFYLQKCYKQIMCLVLPSQKWMKVFHFLLLFYFFKMRNPCYNRDIQKHGQAKEKMNQQYYYKLEDSIAKFLESFRFFLPPPCIYNGKTVTLWYWFYNLSHINNILYTSFYFVTFYSGKWGQYGPRSKPGHSDSSKINDFLHFFYW